MKCPVDKSPLIVLELEQVEIDYCSECKGVWLDAGELELLMGTAPETQHLLASMKKPPRVKEKKRKCPVCAKTMTKVLCGPEQNVLIDKCRLNHGLWLDHGELESLLTAGGLDSDNKIVALLKDMFGNKSV